MLDTLKLKVSTLTYSWPLVQRTSSSWSGPSPCPLNFPSSTTCPKTSRQEDVSVYSVTEPKCREETEQQMALPRKGKLYIDD